MVNLKGFSDFNLMVVKYWSKSNSKGNIKQNHALFFMALCQALGMKQITFSLVQFDG